MPTPFPPTPHYAPFKAGEFRWSMGLSPLDLDDWIQADAYSPGDLAEKERLLAERHSDVFDAYPEGLPGSQEVLALLADHLPARFPELYERAKISGSDHLIYLPTNQRWSLDDDTLHPLDLAARFVQEDLCLMRRDPDDDVYRLVAASVCFPTGWTLADKMGGSVASIHAPIPNYDTQLESTMDRFFDRIKVDRAVERLNWNLMTDPGLFQPRGHIRRDDTGAITPDNAGDRLWLRVERQTLRRLPQTQDILFTIRILVRPLRDIGNEAADSDEAARLVAALQAVPPEVRAYKGLPRVIDAAIAWLEAPPADG
jgi:hypothetical protein